MRLPFGSLKFGHETVSTTYTSLYYTVTRYIPFEVNFLMASKQNPATAVCINYLRYITMIEPSPFSDMRPIGEGLIKRKVFAGTHTI